MSLKRERSLGEAERYGHENKDRFERVNESGPR